MSDQSDQIIMPQLGESIAEGTIVKWLKSQGEAVERDENILLISTDKVEAEIPAPASGILEHIAVQPGQTVPVGTVLGTIAQAGKQTISEPRPEASSAKKEAPSFAPKSPPPPFSSSESSEAARSFSSKPATTDEDPPSMQPSSSSSRFLSPLVRKICMEHQITDEELGRVGGTGQGGRITKNDILSYLKDRAPLSAKASVTSLTPSAFSASHAPAHPEPSKEKAPALRENNLDKMPSILIPPGETEVVKPISTMRRVIMENMLASRKNSAHVTTFFEIDYTHIDHIRHEHGAKFKAEEGISLSYTVFLAAAACQALKQHPYLNAEIQGDRIRFKKDIHLGIAVALQEPEPGLMVPVIRHADQMNLRGLSRAIVDLAARVRSRRVKPDELMGGSFTITNPGNYGSLIGTPIINQPQVAILCVGQIHKQPVVLQVEQTDVIAIRNRGLLSLSFDHRLIDGATADLFMADLKKILENWSMTP